MNASKERLRAWLFPAERDDWLGILRIGLGVQVVLYALSLRSDWNYLCAGTGNGLISRDLAEALLSLESHLVPRFGWFISLASRVGLREETVLFAAWIVFLVAGFGLLAGVFCRPSAVLAWFVHLCAAKSGGLVSYGVDNFMTIGLFYLMLSPLADRFALDWKWRNWPAHEQHWPTHYSFPNRSHLLGFWRRVLQVHLCFIYFFAGLAKALGSGWWNGTNVWRALTRVPFNMIPTETLVSLKYLFPLAGIAVCLAELGYPFGIWNRRTRAAWLISIVAIHIGIGAGMGMYLFSLVMIVLNVAAFGPTKRWATFGVRFEKQPVSSSRGE